jgi:hypothetical protein
MCRLPLDLMTRIIGLVRVPLPSPGTPFRTWDDLRQRDLATRMRVSRVSSPPSPRHEYTDTTQLTYFIAAPLLYKEVVVNNLASFFLGIDDRVQSHHAGCSEVQSTQTNICHAVIKMDGSRHKCCRHPLSSSEDDKDLDASEPGIFHKQQLLQMVEAVHFVYSSANRHMYGNIRLEDYVNGDGTLDEEVLKLVDVGRYLNVPDCIKTGELGNPLPNLERLTVASWLRKKIDINAMVNTTTMCWPGSPTLKAYEIFERLLASRMYQFTAPFVCHHPCRGYLAQYPAPTPMICVNVIHEATPVNFETYLQLGAENLIHFENRFRGEYPIVWFGNDVSLVASELAQVVTRWVESYTDRIQELSFTRLTFVVARPIDQYYSTMTDREKAESEREIRDLKESFKEELESYDLSEHWTNSNWDIVWEECEPACPACSYEWTDLELYGVYLRTPSPSFSDIEPASS